MRIISTKLHGLLDYFMGALLIGSPWLFDFYQVGAESWLPVACGVLVIVCGIFTRYEFGFAEDDAGVSLAFNLNLDLILGIFLFISPLLFEFGSYIYLPHFAMGFLLAFVSLITDRVTSAEFRDYAEKHKLYYLTD